MSERDERKTMAVLPGSPRILKTLISKKKFVFLPHLS